MYKLTILIKSLLLISFLLSKDNLQFSANFLENVIENDIEKRVFKDNVIAQKGSMLLYADQATYIPSLNKVIFNNNVKMFDSKDSLFCDYLVLYDKRNKEFNAKGNVRFYKDESFITSNVLNYLESYKGDTLNIDLYNSVKVIDSQRKVFGDTLHIHYRDSIIQNINILSNARCINSSFARFNKNL